MIYPKLHVDLEWLNRISLNLPRFRKVKTDTFNSRCIVCGDSKTNSKAARLYFYTKKGNLNVICHKCGYSHSFYKFMKDQFPTQFDEYKKETLFDSFKTVKTTSVYVSDTKPVFDDSIKLLTLDEFKKCAINLNELPSSHVAKKYCVDRAFSIIEMNRLYFTEDFKPLASIINKESAKNLVDNEPRIIIPFINRDKKVEMLQGRALTQSKMKYISIKAHDDIQKVYGLYELDETMPVYCVEGPLDSLFIDNCLASCDANLTRVDADVYVWDNQNRNKDIIRYMEKAIDEHRNLVIWPVGTDTKLDINDMVKAGMKRDQLMALLENNTFSGLKAKAKFMQWKKV